MVEARTPLYKLGTCEERLDRYQEMFRAEVRKNAESVRVSTETAFLLRDALQVLGTLLPGIDDKEVRHEVERLLAAGREQFLNVVGGE